MKSGFRADAGKGKGVNRKRRCEALKCVKILKENEMKKLLIAIVAIGAFVQTQRAADLVLTDAWGEYFDCVSREAIFAKLKPMVLKLMKPGTVDLPGEALGLYPAFISMALKNGILKAVPTVAAKNNTTNEKVVAAMSPLFMCSPVADSAIDALNKSFFGMSAMTVLTPLFSVFKLTKPDVEEILKGSIQGMCVSSLEKASKACPIPNAKKPTPNDFFMLKFSQNQCASIVGSKKFQDAIKGKAWMTNMAGNMCTSALYQQLAKLIGDDKDKEITMSLINTAVLKALRMDIIEKIDKSIAEVLGMVVKANIAKNAKASFTAAADAVAKAKAAGELSIPTKAPARDLTVAVITADIPASEAAPDLVESAPAGDDIEF